MYFACGVMMLVGGIFLFIMNYYNYRWLEEEKKPRKVEELQIGLAKELAAMEEVKLSTEEEAVDSTQEP